MGATFWYYPVGQPLKTVDMNVPLSEIIVREQRDEVVHEAISGRRFKIGYSTRWVVRVIAELITDPDLIHELEALCNHLTRGGQVAVGESNDRTLGAFLRVAPEAGDTQLNWYTQLFSGYGGTWTPEAGEVLLLRGPSPRALREDVICGGGGSSTGATLSLATRHDWSNEDWIFVHNRSFWPSLQLQRGQTNADLLQSTRRIHYTLDLPLEEGPHALARLAEEPESPLLGGEIEEGLETLDERVGQDHAGHLQWDSQPYRGGGGSVKPRWF
jgi:hypothetical protein